VEESRRARTSRETPFGLMDWVVEGGGCEGGLEWLEEERGRRMDATSEDMMGGGEAGEASMTRGRGEDFFLICESTFAHSAVLPRAAANHTPAQVDRSRVQ